MLAPTTAPAAHDDVERLAHGIHVVDTGFFRPRFDAAFLIVEDGRAAFVDTGTNHSVPRLLAALAGLGLPADAVDLVIPTHVHLDHAGGAGLLMQHLPRAKLVVHPRGARHLIDPTQLVRGATAVYGAEEVERSYGTPVGVDPERVVTTRDGMTIALAGRPLLFLDTPGHALHHHCIWDAQSRGLFTGDTFGVSYREFDTEAGAWAMPAAVPPQFQPEALRRSVERLLGFDPEGVYLTHYGRVDDVATVAGHLLGQLDEMVALARRVEPGPGRHRALMLGLEAAHLASLRRHGVRLPDARIRALIAVDLELNAQGIGSWLDREAR